MKNALVCELELALYTKHLFRYAQAHKLRHLILVMLVYDAYQQYSKTQSTCQASY